MPRRQLITATSHPPVRKPIAQHARRLRFGWGFWLSMSVLLSLPVGIVAWALGNLIYLPALPRCFNARHAPPADQLYCAEQIASGQGTEDLRRAMVVVNGVPRDHPLRDDSDRLVDFWGREILRRAEEEFDTGNLQAAVEIAMQIPHQVDMRNRAVETVRQWEETWADAEDLYQQAEDYLDAGAWLRALETSRRLLQIDNQYWSTTRYQDLIRTIQTSRETQEREDEENDKVARSDMRQTDNDVDNFIARWEEEQEQEDQARFQQARELASAGTVEGLRSAIAEAQQILYGTGSYDQAQEAIARWRNDIDRIQDQPYLDRAAQLADAGDWDAAIQEARNVSWSSELYEEARDRINEWEDQAAAARQPEESIILPPEPEEAVFPSPFPELPTTPSEVEPALAPFIVPGDEPVLPPPSSATPATSSPSEPED